MQHILKLVPILFAAVLVTSLVWAADKQGNKSLTKIKEEQELNNKGYKLVNLIECDLNGDGRPEKAMFFKNSQKNLGIIAVVDKGKFVQVDKIGETERITNWGKLEGCKVHTINYGNVPKEAFGLELEYGDFAGYMGMYYKWNGQKYEHMSPPDFR